jgi:hypothetical protein
MVRTVIATETPPGRNHAVAAFAPTRALAA